MPKWDVFISHASEDKASFVDPLAQRLRELAVRTWYDKLELVPGDRLSEKIAQGLTECRCGLLVLSAAFIHKPWPKYELSGLVNRFVEEGTRLIPIWYGIDRADVAAFNPALADIYSIIGDPNQIDKCALEVLRAIRPQLYENLKMLSQIDKKVKVATAARSELKDGPIRHHDLPKPLLVRIKNIHSAIRDIISLTLEQSIENYQRDLLPEKEVVVWEQIICALNTALNDFDKPTLEIKKQLFQVLLRFSFGDFDGPFSAAKEGTLDAAIVDASARAWLGSVPSVTISDVENTGL